MREIVDMLEELKSELVDSRGFLIKKPNAKRCVELIERLESALPSEMQEAEYVKQKRKEILANADVVAKNTIRAAEEQAQKLSEQSEIVKNANESAKRIVENAYAQCDNLILRTKAHLDNMFKETEQFLLSTLTVVRTNREELRAVRLDGQPQ